MYKFVYDSKHYFKELVSNQLDRLEDSFLAALALAPLVSFGVYMLIGDVLISPFATIMLAFYLGGTNIYLVESKYRRAKAEYKKEQLLEKFYDSPNYYLYVKKKLDNSELFMNTMKEVMVSLDNIEAMTKENERVAEFVRMNSYYEESRRLFSYLLMNPELFENYLVWATDYISELEKLTAHYNRLVNTEFPYQKYTLIQKIKMDLLKKSNDVGDIIGQDDNIEAIVHIDDFLDELSHTLGKR